MSDHELVCLLENYLEMMGQKSDFIEYAKEQGEESLPTPFHKADA